MNNLLILFLLNVAILGCQSIDCGENGRLNNDSCICDAFFEGETCDQEIRDRFVGVWQSTIRCKQSPSNVFSNEDFIITTTAIDSLIIQSNGLFVNFSLRGKLTSSVKASITPFNAPGQPYLFEAELVQLGIDSLSLVVDDSFVEDTFWPCQFILTR